MSKTVNQQLSLGKLPSSTGNRAPAVRGTQIQEPLLLTVSLCVDKPVDLSGTRC